MVAYDFRNPADADTVAREEWHFARTLWHWYGEWMLYLSDGFTYERRESHPLIGEIQQTLSVTGRDTVVGRECYVVDSWRGSPGRGGSEKRYWIDVQRRVVVRMCDSGICLERSVVRVDSSAAATDTASAPEEKK